MQMAFLLFGAFTIWSEILMDNTGHHKVDGWYVQFSRRMEGDSTNAPAKGWMPINHSILLKVITELERIIL
jgi:hypothetical protein